MKEEMIRLLNPNEIECRIGMISEKGLSLLLYKDARADMKILDEHYGTMNWQRKHEIIGGSLYCTVSIWDENKEQWISKSDVGTESYAEKEKGQASDSFKRACVSVGIGRELYTAPFIWVPASKTKIYSKDEKYATKDRFKVSDISYSESREIDGLTIVNQNGICVFSLIKTSDGRNYVPEGDDSDSFIYDARETAINKELERTGVALDTVLARYGVKSISEMSDAVYKKALSGLKVTKSKAA